MVEGRSSILWPMLQTLSRLVSREPATLSVLPMRAKVAARDAVCAEPSLGLSATESCFSTGLRRVSLLLLSIGLLCLPACQPDDSQQAVDPELLDTRSERLNLEMAFSETPADDSLGPLPVFIDVAAQRGLNFQYHSDEDVGEMNFPEVFGAGVACLDFDLDGWCDVFLPNGRPFPLAQHSTDHRDSLFRNQGGRFSNITLLARLEGFQYSHGCTVGDVNADGFEDLLVANYGQCDVYLNMGDGTFQQPAIPSLAAASQWWMVPLIADLDFDGLPDMLVLPYVDWQVDAPLSKQPNGPGYPGPNEFSALPMKAFRNLGDGNWESFEEPWGLDLPTKAMAIAAVDLDLDGRVELYVANDSTSNYLLTTSGNLHFDKRLTNASRNKHITEEPTVVQKLWQEVGERSGTAASVAGTAEASMSATVADFDSNGLPDLLVTNYFGRTNSLYANRGQLNFRDISSSSRMDAIGKSFLSFGASPVDYDLDGDWDLIVANGHVLGPNAYVYQQTHQFLRNVEGTFIDISGAVGGYFRDVQSLGRSTATLDFDNDGDSDVIMTHIDRPVSLLENQTAVQAPRLTLEIADRFQRPLEGTRIVVGPEQEPFSNISVIAGGSYLSESHRQWTIGLGTSWDTNKTVPVSVHWTDGSVDQWQLEPNSRGRLLPGSYQRLDRSRTSEVSTASFDQEGSR